MNSSSRKVGKQRTSTTHSILDIFLDFFFLIAAFVSSCCSGCFPSTSGFSRDTHTCGSAFIRDELGPPPVYVLPCESRRDFPVPLSDEYLSRETALPAPRTGAFYGKDMFSLLLFLWGCVWHKQFGFVFTYKPSTDRPTDRRPTPNQPYQECNVRSLKCLHTSPVPGAVGFGAW